MLKLNTVFIGNKTKKYFDIYKITFLVTLITL